MLFWYCWYCGYENTDNRTKCRQCGHPKPTKEVTE